MFKRSITPQSYEDSLQERLPREQSLIRSVFFEKPRLRHWFYAQLFFCVLAAIVQIYFAWNQQIEVETIHQKMIQIEHALLNLKSISSKRNFDQEQFEDLDEVIEIPDLRYLGMLSSGRIKKALIEINEDSQTLTQGQAIDDDWVLRVFDQNNLVIEHSSGQKETFSREAGF